MSKPTTTKGDLIIAFKEEKKRKKEVKGKQIPEHVRGDLIRCSVFGHSKLLMPPNRPTNNTVKRMSL